MNRREIENLLLHTNIDSDENQHDLMILEFKLEALLNYLKLEVVESSPIRVCPFTVRPTKTNNVEAK